MNIVKNDPYVKDLPTSALTMLQSVVEAYDFVEDVILFQTIECYIARFKRKHYQPHFKGQPDRLSTKDLLFLARLDRVEFIEASCDELRICFTVERAGCLDWGEYPDENNVASEGDIMELTKPIIDAVLEAESVLSDLEVAIEKGYIPSAQDVIYKAAYEIRHMQKLANTWNCLPKGKVPDWSQFNGLEIAGVYTDSDSGVCERVEEGEHANYYTLYGHLKTGGCESLHDFPEGFKDTASIVDTCEQVAAKLGFQLLDCT